MPEKALNIADIRQDYRLSALDETATGADPIAFFEKWFAEASTAQINDVNAMTLATAESNGMPHARTVLLKGVDGADFIFYTNYDSSKGREISENPKVALVFYWKELERQVRIEGTVEKVTAAESDAYFISRPEGSRIGAWASPQSQPITDREILDTNYAKYTEQFAVTGIPRPPHWGGYRVTPNLIEFWQGRSSRMHDRILLKKNDTGTWDKSRLAP